MTLPNNLPPVTHYRRLAARGITTVTISVTGIPSNAGLMQVSNDLGVTWKNAVWNGNKTSFTFQCAGHSATGVPPDALVFPAGKTDVDIRLNDNPDDLVAEAFIVVTVTERA